MHANYILTDLGRSIIRNKISQSEKLILSKVVFGDKITNLNKEISRKDVDLISPKLSSPIERLYYIAPENEHEIMIKLSSVVSELYTNTLEPITIREYGIYDVDDNLIFIGETKEILTKIDTDPRDILFDIIISLATPVKVFKTIIGHYSGWSPEQKTIIENITINVNNINTTIVEYGDIITRLDNELKDLKLATSNSFTNIENRVAELESCCESMDVNAITGIINSNNQKINNLEILLNESLLELRDRLTVVENSPGGDTTEIMQKITVIENVLNVDFPNMRERLTILENNVIDITSIENRLTVIENKPDVDLSNIENKITNIENKYESALTTIDNRITDIENNPTSVDLTDIENRLTTLENKTVTVDLTDINNKITELENLIVASNIIDLTELNNRVTALEAKFPIDLSTIENKIDLVEDNTKNLTDAIIDRVVVLEEKPNLDYSNLEGRVTTLESRPTGTVDLTTIENRLDELESRPTGTVDLTNIEGRLVELENKPEVNLTTIENRLNELESVPIIDLTPLESRVSDLENNSVIDLTPIEDRLTNIESQLPVDLSGLETRLTSLENNPNSGLDLLYTNPDPTPAALGGIPAGTTFDNVNIKDIISMLLYPYQKPAFTTFKVNNLTTLALEVGSPFAGGNVTFSWTISNSMAIAPNSIMCNGVPDLPNTGSFVQNIAPIVKTTATGHTFTITAITDKGEMIYKNATFNWQFKRYVGVSPKLELTDEDILAMSGELATNRTKTANYDCAGGRYFYIIYPTSFGEMSNVRIESFLWDDYTLVKRTMVNAYGVSVPVNIYRSNNLLNGTVTVNWS